MNAVEEPNRSEVLEISKAGNAVFRECAFRLFKCPECRVLSSHLIVRLALSDGTLFQPVLSCHACNRQLVEVSLEEIDSAACPICDRPALADELLLCWD